MADEILEMFQAAFSSSDAVQILQEAGASNIRATDTGISFELSSGGGNLDALLLRPYREQRMGYTKRDGTQVRGHVVNYGAPTTGEMLEAQAKDDATSTKVGETTITSFIEAALRNMQDIKL